MALGELPDALLLARRPGPPGRQRRRPGRDLHVGEVAPWRSGVETDVASRRPGPGGGAAGRRLRRGGRARRVVDAPLRRPARPLGRLPAPRRQRADVPHLLRLPLGRPGGAARGPAGDPAADRADPPRRSASTSPSTTSTGSTSRASSCTSTSATRTRTTSRSARRSSRGCRRRSRSRSAPSSSGCVDRDPGRGDLGDPAAARCVDRTTMGGALLAISAPVYWLGLIVLLLFAQDIGFVHAAPRRRQLRADHERPRAVVPRR